LCVADTAGGTPPTQLRVASAGASFSLKRLEQVLKMAMVLVDNPQFKAG